MKKILLIVSLFAVGSVAMAGRRAQLKSKMVETGAPIQALPLAPALPSAQPIVENISVVVDQPAAVQADDSFFPTWNQVRCGYHALRGKGEWAKKKYICSDADMQKGKAWIVGTGATATTVTVSLLSLLGFWQLKKARLKKLKRKINPPAIGESNGSSEDEGRQEIINWNGQIIARFHAKVEGLKDRYNAQYRDVIDSPTKYSAEHKKAFDQVGGLLNAQDVPLTDAQKQTLQDLLDQLKKIKWN